MEAGCFRYGGLIVVEVFVRRCLSGDNVAIGLMEADCFRYRDELEYMLSYALRLSVGGSVGMEFYL